MEAYEEQFSLGAIKVIGSNVDRDRIPGIDINLNDGDTVSYLRSKMTQERLNELALMTIESNLLDKVVNEDVIEKFITRNIRRIAIFK
ncbi:hypothetical protein LXL04_028483 [Taraxacum kok-saghyz]